MAKKKINQLDSATITLTQLVGHGNPTTGKMFKATWAQVVALFAAQTPVKTYPDIEDLLANTNLVIGYLAFVAEAGGDYGDPEITSGWGFYLYNGPDADELTSYTLLASEEGIGGGSAEHFRGAYNASGDVFPSSGGSTGGVPQAGDEWHVSVPGDLEIPGLGVVTINVGALLKSLVNTPGQTATNWKITQ